MIFINNNNVKIDSIKLENYLEYNNNRLHDDTTINMDHMVINLLINRINYIIKTIYFRRLQLWNKYLLLN